MSEQSLPAIALFAPSSGPAGSGEYYRCLTLARGLQQRRPDLKIHFLLHAEAAVERDDRFVYHSIRATPTRAGSEVLAFIQQLEPVLVVFDSSGRTRYMRAARRLGAATVWISDRPIKRFKAFRPHQMCWLDLHLIIDLGAGGRMRLHERLLARLCPRTQVRVVDGIVEAPDPAALEAELPGILDRSTSLGVFVAGGGGYRHAGRPVPEILHEAAREFSTKTGLQALVVAGPQYRGQLAPASGVDVIQALSTGALGALLGQARVAVTGAGAMISAQMLAAGSAAVLVAAGGSDQPRRIRRLTARGLAHSARLEAAMVADSAARLAASESQRREMIHRQQTLDLSADTTRVVGLLVELVAARRPQPD